MASPYDTISFLSDYGLADEFVGVVKGVIRTLAPHAVVIDICHEVPPHDVRAGALTLARSVQYLPPGVVLAVVDPAVGTDRRAVAVEVKVEAGTQDEGQDGQGDGPGPGSGQVGQKAVFVGPDNGLLASAVALTGGAHRAVALTNEAYHLPAPGPTFAGRDVFAPAAAHLCCGVDLAELGPEIDPLTLLPGLLPLPRQEDGALVGEVLWVDRFGNVQLNMGPEDLDLADLGEKVTLRYRDQIRTAERAPTYAAIRPGQVGLVVDSYGLVSLALDRMPAAAELKLAPGDAVTIEEPT
jgi:S-adenosylmethionine hydrolase